MNHLEQLAVDARLAIYFKASPDASEVEFLNLKPIPSHSGCKSHAIRWPGSGLRGISVIGCLADGSMHVESKAPLTASRLPRSRLPLQTTVKPSAE